MVYADMFEEISDTTGSNDNARGIAGLMDMRSRMDYTLTAPKYPRVAWADVYICPIKHDVNVLEVPIAEGQNTLPRKSLTPIRTLYEEHASSYIKYAEKIGNKEPYCYKAFVHFIRKYIDLHPKYAYVQYHFCTKCKNGFINSFDNVDLRSQEFGRQYASKQKKSREKICPMTHRPCSKYTIEYIECVYNMTLI